ncbi:threonine ammonia-lyase [bacterium]|nr:threonine ammonia-lyase [bacterium]
MADKLPVSLDAIREARARIAPYVRATPLIPLDALSKDGRKVLMKCELFQRTGSFKMRGATNCILENLEQAKRNGVVAASAGNHAQGVAAICKELGIRATIVMPTITPPVKIKNTLDWGATVELHGKVVDESFQKAQTIAKEKGNVLIHPFRDPFVMAGQGTIGLELVEDPLFQDIEAVAIAIGGGGLISGCASVIKALRPEIKVYGITALNAPTVASSFAQKKVIEEPVQITLADTIATKKMDPTMLQNILSCVDEVLGLSEESIAHAIALLAEKAKMVVEGSGAIAVSAILENKIPEKKIAVILCGGNIDLPSFGQVLNRGLVEQGRLVRLVVTIVDRPGGLNAVTEVFAQSGANIQQVYHQRASLEAGFGKAQIEVEIETRGSEHTQEILHALAQKGFQVRHAN